MKSLEIIDEIIANFEDRVEFEKIFLKANPSERPRNKFIRQLEGSKQIKQDLEVLEIIRKKKVDVASLKEIIEFSNTNEYILHVYNYNHSRYTLTMEELLKLKQWLEVNE